jgi:eukaryotic-like serine/threonine-protein kinase
MARAAQNRAAILFGPFRFDAGNGLWRDGREVPLPPRALGVLEALVAEPGVVVAKQALIDSVWRDAFVTEASLLEAIKVLRDALEDDRLNPTYIQTVHRRGYRFIAAVQSMPVESIVEPAPTVDAVSPAREGDRAAEHAARTARGPWPGPEWRPLIVAGVASCAAVIGVALVFALFGQRPSEPRPTVRFTIALPEDMTIDPLRGSVAVSADGLRMVYVALHEGRPRLFLRTIDGDVAQLVDGSDDAADPFFSPDGRWIGFFARGVLKKLRVDGGTPVVLSPARAGAGASWGRDGTIVFGGGPGGGLARVSQNGGDPVVLTAPPAGSRDVSYGWPDLLPDETGVIYTATSLAGSRVAFFDLASGTSHAVVDSGAFARYSPTGHIVFERRGRLEAAPFSIGERRVTAPPQPILRGVATSSALLGGPRFAFSRAGSLMYVPGASPDAGDRLHWLDVQGGLEPLPLPPAQMGAVDIAPDLQQLAMTVESDAGADLWVGDLRRGAVSRLSADGGSVSPTWRPDGLEIAFAYSKAGPFNIFVLPTDTSAPARPLAESPWNQLPTSWSHDGRLLAFTEFNPMTGADLWLLDVVTRERRQFVRTLFDESHGRFSPDGRWLAYMSNESGRWDVFVRPVSAGSGRVQVSTDGGAWPSWSIDGRTLYFNTNGRAAAAAVHTATGLRVSAPMIIPGRGNLQLAAGRAAPDRVLVRQGGAMPARRELRVVLEWFTELTRLARLPA